MERTWTGSTVVGSLPRGCDLCMKGMKLVLFITGLCHRRCFYCPLSKARRGRDVVFANERPVVVDEDVLREAELMDARGAGLTGGDPLLRPERTTRYLRLLKESFGEGFHVHLYTAFEHRLTSTLLSKLADVGLDELRIHPDLSNPERCVKAIRTAGDEGLTVGVEIPALPGELERLKMLASLAERAGASFIIVNELEMNEENSFQLRVRGFRIKQSSLSAVEGSEEVAMSLLSFIEDELSLNAHYCPAKVKDVYQYKGRLKRMALRAAKPYEEVTDEGLLRKAVVLGGLDELRRLATWLSLEAGLPRDHVFLSPEEGRLETTVAAAVKAKECRALEGLKAFIVEEYPTFDRRLFLSEPI